MCLIKVKKEEEEDTYVPVRVHRVERDTLRVASPHHHHHHHSPNRHSSTRISRTSVRHSNPAVIEVPSPPALAVPPPQPVPIFVQPPPPPPPPPVAPEVHYVHVSPPSNSSRSSSPHSHYDHHYERREIREYRDSSPARSPRGGDYYDYRYVDAGPERHSQRRLRSRSRSRSRGGDIREYIDEPERRRSTKVKVVHVDDHGNRRRSRSRGDYYD